MSFQIVGDDMSWKNTGAFVKVDGKTAKSGDVRVEKESLMKYSLYIHRFENQTDGYYAAEKFRQCYAQCLFLAVSYQCESIVFPIMGEEICGLDREQEIKIACKVFHDFLEENEIDIFLSIPNRGETVLPEKIVNRIADYINDNYMSFRLAGAYESGHTVSTEENRRRTAFSNLNAVEGQEHYDDKERNINVYIKEQNVGTFIDYLEKLIKRKGLTNAEVYKRANLTKQYFSKLLNGRINPTKEKLLCIAIALRLDLDETVAFLNFGGYALTPYNKTDLVFKYFIIQKDFDIFNIDIALFDLGLPSLMD